ncbi:S8 family peptidase [Desulfogranum marinum]|uniref:S8 family peptidase n=1 Tax=Desulfogranum marinum TaxID=453220 RepID=UPI00196697FE|nr:S8 family serine peptidase [Desulfogranum marinum]MBM9511471.1 S8 family serine peptidase [Desulfogranum marinum]
MRQILAELSIHGVDIQADPTINPTVSVHLKNVPFSQGLPALLRPVNHVITWKKDGDHNFLPHTIQIFAPGMQHRMEPFNRSHAFRTIRHPTTGSLILAGELLIQKKTRVSDALFQKHIRSIGGRILGKIDATGLCRVSFPLDSDIEALLSTVAKLESVASTEPHFAYTIRPSPFLVEASLPAKGGSAALPTSSSHSIAVLDSGLTPEALSLPWVAATYDAVQPYSQIQDPSGHGTQMAQLASGAVSPLGVSANQADQLTSPVIAVRVFDQNGVTSNFSIIQALDFAMANHAKVVSMSWGGSTKSEFLDQALQTANANDLILVAAAGNEATGESIYPAAFENVIGVGALKPDGTPWESSNFGPFVEVQAAGFAPFVQKEDNTPMLFAGTSISTAYIAHTIASFLDTHPDATLQEVRTMLQKRF